MQKEQVLSKKSIAGIVLLLILLVLVRVFEEQLFYDPLLPFFKRQNNILPEYNSIKLFFGLFFRYAINSVLSLAIIYLAFKDSAITRLSTILYAGFFIVLIAALFIALKADDPNLLLIFYIRRFIIQPLFLILFLPAFYYQKKMK